MASIGVLIVEQNRLLREGLKQILPRNRFTIRAELNAVEDAWALFENNIHPPLQLAICCISDWSNSAFEAISKIKQHCPQLHWILLAPKQDAHILRMAVSCGVSGVLSKDISPVALRNCLELVLLGEHIFPSSAIFLDDDPMTVKPEPRNDYRHHQDLSAAETVNLSENQRAALNFVMRGASNKVIAREMGIAETTVKVHLKALMKKLNANNRTQVAVLGLRGSSLEAPPETDAAANVSDVTAPTASGF